MLLWLLKICKDGSLCHIIVVKVYQKYQSPLLTKVISKHYERPIISSSQVFAILFVLLVLCYTHLVLNYK